MPPETNHSPPSDHPHRYNADFAGKLELRWQAEWEKLQAFKVPNPGEPGFDASRPKFFCMDMFPYPSGAGLHVGHPEGYTATDIVCRYKRMKGFNVLHPMGWDAFGLPAEQYAIQTGVHPAITTRKAIDTFRRQLKRFGFCYDWSREFATIDENYYKWTQWIFLQIYNAWYDEKADRARPISELIERLENGTFGVGLSGELIEQTGEEPGSLGVFDGSRVGLRRWHELDPRERRAFIDNQRLAYIAEQVVNWCPKLGTALANEEVIDGKSERGSFPVFRKPLRQWMFKITAYAHRLLEDLKGLDWPTSTRTMQEEWIGRSEGAEIEFELEANDDAADEDSCRSLRVFTTRPDTIFGATYMVVAPEHELIEEVLAGRIAVDASTAAALREYVSAARNRSDVERQENKEKTGVFTGVYAVNPATEQKIPVWTADYVLTGYGTGAIMAVPAHDERDYEFAKKFALPIRDVLYDRPRFAMHYFARHAPAPLKTEDVWQGALADFLGLVTNETAGLDRMPACMQKVLTGRKSGPAPTAVQTYNAPPEPREGEIGHRRGVTQIGWLDAIEAMKFAGWDDFSQRFTTASVFAVDGDAFVAEALTVNSTNAGVSLDGLPTGQAKARIIAWLEEQGIGSRKINYKLRDWLFSRQRYWGEPFPIVFDSHGDPFGVGENVLPVALPPMDDYHPEESDEPKPLLGKAKEWVKTTAGAAGVSSRELPAEAPVTRETNTMPGWAGSCWYYLRYCDPKNATRFCSQEAERYWMGGGKAAKQQSSKATNEEREGAGGVDLYIGGSEHAVLHLLYARFWHKALFDLGHVSTKEPFQKLFHQGLITSFSYQRPDKSLVPTDLVEERGEGQFIERATGGKLAQVTAKMSKSLKNVVNPDDVIAEFGADTFRLYEMYMGPLEASKPWNPRDITGCFRFLQRAWRLCVDEQTGALRFAEVADDAIERLLHRTIAKVEGDIDRLAFNTAIAALIQFVNEATAEKPTLTRSQAERFALTLAPFAPHMAEELWAKLGGIGFASHAAWPAYDEAMLKDSSVEMPVQIMGKIKARIIVAADLDAKGVEAAALADSKVQEALAGKSVKRVIVVPGKMVNVVVG